MKKRQVFLALLLLVLAAWPFLFGRFYVNLMAQVFILGMAAMSLNLLIGYTGLVSMGHAAFFGTGAYTVGFLARHLETANFWLGAPAAVLAAALLALLAGYFALRTSAVTFLMITLALGEMLWALALKWSKVTGGSDGLPGIPRPTGFGIEMTYRELYWLSLLIGLLTYWLIRRLLDAPFGRTLIGIRENEGRMRALGCDVQRYKLAAFVLAAAIAGLGGGLFAYLNGFASPSELNWHRSGQFMIMTIIGGSGTLVGPLLGSFVILVVQDWVSSFTMRWMTIMGLLFIGFVLAARGGLAGIWRRLGRVRA